MIRGDPSRSELIRPGLAVRVDPVRLLYLPDRNRGLAWPLPKMPQNLLTAEGLVAAPGQSITEELPNHSTA